MPVYIAVCGPDPGSDDVLRETEEVGRLLARSGAVLVCGGLGGTMEAAARGVSSEGGISIGILPGSSRREGNSFLTYSIPTGMGEMRNALIVRSADALIAVAGEFGTLAEIAFALKTGVPVIGLGTWQLSKSGQQVPDPILRVETPAEAVSEAIRLAGATGSSGSGSG